LLYLINVATCFDLKPLSGCSDYVDELMHMFLERNTVLSPILVLYRVADKSLARPDWKNNWKVIFRPTRRSLLPRRPGWTTTFWICFWVACNS